MPAHLEGEAHPVAHLEAIEQRWLGHGKGHHHRAHTGVLPVHVAELGDLLVVDEELAAGPGRFRELAHDTAGGVAVGLDLGLSFTAVGEETGGSGGEQEARPQPGRMGPAGKGISGAERGSGSHGGSIAIRTLARELFALVSDAAGSGAGPHLSPRIRCEAVSEGRGCVVRHFRTSKCSEHSFGAKW